MPEDNQRLIKLTKNVNIFNEDILKLPWAVNRRLKNTVIDAATSAIRYRDNVFKDYYERMLSNEITPAIAKHSVARKMISTM